MVYNYPVKSNRIFNSRSVFLLSTFLFLLLVGCSEEEPNIIDEEETTIEINWRKTHDLDDFIQSFTSNGLIEDTVILQVVIASTDNTGNIEGIIYLQEGSTPLSINISGSASDNNFNKGDEIFLLLTGLFFDAEKQQVFGDNNNTSIEIEQLAERSQNISTDNSIYFDIVTDLSDLNDSYNQKSIKVYGVQFNESLVGQKIAELEESILQDDEGNQIGLRISENSSLSDFEVPYESGNIEGILLVENNAFTIVPDALENLAFTSKRHSLFQAKTFEFNGASIPYQMMLPRNHDSETSYPLVIFLHGAGERGTNNTSQLAYGTQVFNNQKAREEYPAIVIYPQCPPEFMWSRREIDDSGGDRIFSFPVEDNPNEPMGLVIELTKSLIASGDADPNKIYVMGLSMGGIGTLEYLYYAPDLPVAAISIAGGHDSSLVSTYGNDIAIRLYHGSNDGVVPPKYSRDLIEALNELPNEQAEYFEAEGKGHEWNYILNESDSILSWLWSNSK
ncbi:hypothetical protein GCM10027429_31780 [Marivirga atlantica]|jgi:predicted esterase